MKKLLALLGGTALAAAVIPYAYQKNEETDEKTIQALLWKATIAAAGEDGQQKLSLSVGFNSPFQPQKNDLFADNLTVNYHTAPSCGIDPDADCYADCDCTCGCACDADCGCEEEAPCCCQEEAQPAPAGETAADEPAAEDAAADDQ